MVLHYLNVFNLNIKCAGWGAGRRWDKVPKYSTWCKLSCKSSAEDAFASTRGCRPFQFMKQQITLLVSRPVARLKNCEVLLYLDLLPAGRELLRSPQLLNSVWKHVPSLPLTFFCHCTSPPQGSQPLRIWMYELFYRRDITQPHACAPDTGVAAKCVLLLQSTLTLMIFPKMHYKFLHTNWTVGRRDFLIFSPLALTLQGEKKTLCMY